MTNDKLNRFWLLAISVIIVIIIASSIYIWLRRDSGLPIEISSPPEIPFYGEIYLDGAVNNPGTFPLKSSDSLDSLLRASGGTTNYADLSRIYLHIPYAGEGAEPQKVNLNRAPVWLLQSLPNIGEARAQAIVNYRQKYGAFQRIEDVTRVTGISSTIYEKIRDYITVAE